ncbi:MAG: tail fiber domain-containing protein [Phycisphaerales bacterium]|nr:tail fiber domain-containing protein [Planctomycetota bacterium]
MKFHAIVGLLLACAGFALTASAQSSFTYQGRVTDSGAPMNGTANLQLSLWKDAVSNNIADRIGNIQSLSGVSISNGVFTVVANSLAEFGVNPFNGDPRWLQISVNGVPILPRQPLLATPYASGLASGGGAINNSATTRTLSLINLSTSDSASGASTLYVQKGSPSTVAAPVYGSGAMRIETASGSGLISFSSANSGSAVVAGTNAFGASGLTAFSQGNTGYGVFSTASGSSSAAVYAWATGGSSSALIGLVDGPNSYGIYARSYHPTSWAGWFDGPTQIQVASGQTLEFRFDQFVPMINVNNPGPNAGHMRLRNALEIWPSLDTARAGFLDVRNTAGAQTITLNGANGNIFATGTITPSSRKLKENIAPIADALEKLLRIQGVRYDWIPPESAKRGGKLHDIGFIAENVDEQFPEMVARDESGAVIGMDYARMSAVTVEAIKQLRANFEVELTKRDRENAELRARLEKLEKLLAPASSNCP